MKNMNKFLSALSVLLLAIIVAFSQEREGETYRILSTGNASEIEPYINALNAANMQYHRLKNQRHTIVFDTGVKVELFSGTELITAGREININDYPESFPVSRQEPNFFLGANNYILEEHRNTTK